MQRERITITVDHDLLMGVDAIIDGTNLRNRSQALEYAVRTGLSLYEISSLFIIQCHTFSPDLPGPHEIAKTLKPLGFHKIYAVQDSTIPDSHKLWTQSLASELRIERDAVRILPADFGTGGALLLVEKELSPSFMIMDPNHLSSLSGSILAGYTHHRSSGKHLTELITMVEGTHYAPVGISFCEKSVATTIPAGMSDIRRDLFAPLAKDSKMGTYVIS